MREFEKKPVCEKCSSSEVSVCYRDLLNNMGIEAARGLYGVLECLACSCDRCGFKWSMNTYDAKKG